MQTIHPDLQLPSSRALSESAKARLIILLVGILAYGMAMKAGFYMDDYFFVVNSTQDGRPLTYHEILGFRFGDSDPQAVAKPLSMFLPLLIFKINHAIFGVSPVGAHLWNLLLHLGIAQLVYSTAKRFLSIVKVLPSETWVGRVALWTGLLFVAHPLCSEPVNYAKCVYMELVGLTSLMTCYFVLRFFQEPKRPAFLGLMALGGLLAGLSYPYGLPITLVQAGTLLILLPWPGGGWWAWFKGSRPAQIVVGVASISLLCFVQQVWSWWMWHLDQMDFPYQNHFLTQCRVFWGYIVRMIMPVNLCSDHQVPWSTRWTDIPALLSFCGIILLLITCAVSGLRKKSTTRWVLALLALLISLPLLVRFPYASHEPMVEYRTYASMPWVAMGFALGLRWLYSAMEKRLGNSPLGQWITWVPATFVGLFVLLSMSRSAQWSSDTRLCKDVLAKYPLNLRPVVALQYVSNAEGEFTETLALQRGANEAFAEMKRRNATDPQGRQFDIFWMEKTLMGTEELSAVAIAYLYGSATATSMVEKRLNEIKQTRPDICKSDTEYGIATPLLEALHQLQKLGPLIDSQRASGSVVPQ